MRRKKRLESGPRGDPTLLEYVRFDTSGLTEGRSISPGNRCWKVECGDTVDCQVNPSPSPRLETTSLNVLRDALATTADCIENLHFLILNAANQKAIWILDRWKDADLGDRLVGSLQLWFQEGTVSVGFFAKEDEPGAIERVVRLRNRVIDSLKVDLATRWTPCVLPDITQVSECGQPSAAPNRESLRGSW